ncbi:DUF4013 domain-containing protein [Ruficoccus sp. ZRK36]|uniref:DUF4013 domain-containing protein n=1 Tax=Ruficoccus sp. ZRK36 TaxID=2866311 RepID=UPI001C732DC2|nr:DUF4013 domain-containing protein [Ruficoccus sp. ZRK36]QYY34786.1 DUF4013 domain-containing protein [Ruficoccus sp. ZRK36]
MLCLSIIGLPFAFGYCWRYLEQIRARGDFSLPSWSEPAELLLPGLKALAVFIVWFCLPWGIALAVQAFLAFIFGPLGFLAMIACAVVLWGVCGLFVSALWAFQRNDSDWRILIDLPLIWKPFARNWRRLVVSGLAFLGLVGLFFPLLPFAFFGGFLPLLGYTSQVFILTQEAS